MSTFHGGFLLTRVEPSVADSVRSTTAAYLDRSGVPVHAHRLTFCARAGCPLLQVAIRGGDADGKGYCYFNREHAALGGLLARAIGATVYAYSYEDQVGTESLAIYSEDGNLASEASVSWDDLPDDSGRPLALLADELGIGPGVLESDLPYDTPALGIALDAVDAEAALTRYLADLGPVDDAALDTSLDKSTLFFPQAMAREAGSVAVRLGLPLGHVFWAAWEISKHELAASCDEPCELGASDPPREILLGGAGNAPEPLAGSDKTSLTLALPTRVLGEVRELAAAADRSLSWCLQSAWKLARARLLAAERAPEAEPECDQTLYFDEAVLGDVKRTAAGLGLSSDRVLVVAWELGKTALHEAIGGFDGEGSELPPRPAPAVVAPPELELGAAAGNLPPIELSGEKARVSVRLPERVLEELRDFAAFADRSLSWVVFRAYEASRPALRGARRR